MGPFVQRLRPEIHSSLSILLLFSRLTQQPALSSPLEHILSPHCPPSQPSLAHTAQHLINPGSDLFCHLLPVSLQLPLLFHSHSPHPAPALTSPPLPWITATASRLFYECLLSPPHPAPCPAAPAILLTHPFHRLLSCSNTFIGSLWPVDCSPLCLPGILSPILSQTNPISTETSVPYLGLCQQRLRPGKPQNPQQK